MIPLMGISKRPFKVAGRSSWHYKVDGKRKSLETTNYNDAVKILSGLRKKYVANRIDKISGNCVLTLKDFREEYEKTMQGARSYDTLRADLLSIRKLEQIVGEDARINELNMKHVDLLITSAVKAGLKVGSINNYIRHLRCVFAKAVDWEHLLANPFRAAKELPKEKRPAVYIHAADIADFLKRVSDIDKRRLVTAYIYTGRRRRELLNLRWKDISFDREEYFIEKSKIHLSKWYPMHKMFKQVLIAIGPREPEKRVFARWDHPDTISHIVKEALTENGLGHLHLHHMRHTFAVLLKEQGVDDATVGDLLGHTDRRATEIYAHISDTRARSAIDLIKGGPVDLMGTIGVQGKKNPGNSNG